MVEGESNNRLVTMHTWSIHRGMSECGNFNWTVKQFNNKLHFKAEGSKGKGLTDDLAIKVFVPISTLIVGFIIGISVTLCVWKKPCSQERDGYSSLPQNT